MMFYFKLYESSNHIQSNLIITGKTYCISFFNHEIMYHFKRMFAGLPKNETNANNKLNGVMYLYVHNFLLTYQSTE